RCPRPSHESSIGQCLTISLITCYFYGFHKTCTDTSQVSSTRNALRIAAQAEETGRSTLERLGAQGERIHNTERNLDLVSHSTVAAPMLSNFPLLGIKGIGSYPFAISLGEWESKVRTCRVIWTNNSIGIKSKQTGRRKSA